MFIVILNIACSPAPRPVDLKAALAHLCDGPELSADAPYLAVFEGPPPTLAVSVILMTEIVVDGENVALSALQEHLSDKAQMGKELASRAGEAFAFRGELLLQVSRDTPGSRLVPVLDSAAAAGFREIQFVGRSGQAQPEIVFADPAFARAVNATQEIPPELRQRARAEITDGILEACEPLIASSRAVADAPAETKCDVLVEVLEETLPKCPDADAGKIVTLFQLVPGGEHRLTTLATRLDPKAPIFEVRPGETWQAILPRLQAAGPATRWSLTETGE